MPKDDTDDRPQIAKDMGLPKGKANYGPDPAGEKMTAVDRVKAASRALIGEGPKEALRNWRENKKWNQMLDYEASHNKHSKYIGGPEHQMKYMGK